MSEVKRYHEFKNGVVENEYGMFVKHTDYAELKSQRDALAAEMSVVESIHDKCVFITDDDYDACPKNVQEIIRSLAVMQIPATEAYLNSVRAEGIEMAADYLKMNHTVSSTGAMAHLLNTMASKIRAGEPS